MTPEDTRRIEDSLGVTLPSEYRHLLLNPPVQYDRGTPFGDLWDDADAIIERNQELRSKRRSLGKDYDALPNRYLFVGDDSAGWQHLVDLDSDKAIVNIMQFEAVDSISPARDNDENDLSISDWFHERLIELRDGGIDISSSDQPGKITPGGVVGVLLFCVIIATIFALVTIGIDSLNGR
ncbi:MAG: SMI1/KNR4 family protein [Fuerstiella sp.]